MSSTLLSCEEEAQNYMKKHKIVELLDNLTAQVVFHRPGTLMLVLYALCQSAQSIDSADRQSIIRLCYKLHKCTSN